MTINQAIKLGTKILREHKELNSWTVVTNKRKAAFGVCNYSLRRIELSEILIPRCTDESIKDTIIHEIAHALTEGHNHDKVWKAKCIELGGNGKRCGGEDNYKDGAEGRNQLKAEISKYTLTCPVCGEKYHRNRRPSKQSSCGKHGTRGYDPKYKLTLAQNY